MKVKIILNGLREWLVLAMLLDYENHPFSNFEDTNFPLFFKYRGQKCVQA